MDAVGIEHEHPVAAVGGQRNPGFAHGFNIDVVVVAAAAIAAIAAIIAATAIAMRIRIVAVVAIAVGIIGLGVRVDIYPLAAAEESLVAVLLLERVAVNLERIIHLYSGDYAALAVLRAFIGNGENVLVARFEHRRHVVEECERATVDVGEAQARA